MQHTIPLLAASAGLMLGAVSPAQAFTVTPSTITDSEFEQLILGGEFDELFVAESRAGDNNGRAGDYEVSINKALVPNGSGGLSFPGTFAQGNNQWVPGEAVAFSLSYDASTGNIEYAVGDQTLNASTTGLTPNGIFLRTRAQGRNSDSSASLLLQNLQLNDGSGFQPIANLGSASAAGERDVDYLIISGLQDSFTLTGEEIFGWSGSYPRGSRLATQIKVGGGTFTAPETEPVPEPLTILGTMTALGVGYGLKRRRNAAEA